MFTTTTLPNAATTKPTKDPALVAVAFLPAAFLAPTATIAATPSSPKPCHDTGPTTAATTTATATATTATTTAAAAATSPLLETLCFRPAAAQRTRAQANNTQKAIDGMESVKLKALANVCCCGEWKLHKAYIALCQPSIKQ
jgi:hypothetical protein